MMSFKSKMLSILIKLLSLYNYLCRSKDDVVFVRLDRLGDFVIWLGIAEQFRSYYNNRHITLICRKMNYELAKLTGYFDRIVAIDNKSEIRKLIGMKCNILVNPTYSRDELSEFVSTIISAKMKIAIDGDDINKKHCSLSVCDNIYDKLIETPKDYLPEVQRNQIFFNKYTKLDNSVKITDLKPIIKKVTLKKDYYVINLGGSSKARLWPTENFVSVAEDISKIIPNLSCVLIGSTSEQELSDRFVGLHPETESYVGKTSIMEMMSIIAGSKFVLCNDTSTVHISAALDIPCYCVAPGYQFPRFTLYPKELIEENRTLPVFIQDYRDCFGCFLKEGFDGLKDECKESVAKGKQYCCILNITPEMVSKVITENI